MIDLIETIKQVKQERNLTTYALASQIGVSAAYLDMILTKKRNPTFSIIGKILNELDLSLSILTNLKGEIQTVSNNKTTPKVFISYSHDSEQHKRWVLNLANNLMENGIDIVFDQYHLSTGKDLKYFMSNSIQEADKIIIILSENYKKKAESLSGGVGFEYSIIRNKLFEQITNNSLYLPILKSGDFKSSVPDFMASFLYLDMRTNDLFAQNFNKLLRNIYDEPLVKKPELGEKPDFENEIPIDENYKEFEPPKDLVQSIEFKNDKTYRDIGVVIALKEEFKEFFTKFPSQGIYDEEKDMYFYDIESNGYKIVASFLGGMGPTKAALHTERLLTKFNIGTIVNIGIAGGLDKNIRIGDVVIGTQIDGFLEDGKITGESTREVQFKFSGDVFRTSTNFKVHADNINFNNPKAYEKFKTEGRDTLASDIESKILGKLVNGNILNEFPEIYTGSIASSSVVSASNAFNQYLKTRNRHFLAVEMESFGILKGSERFKNQSLIIRGISDLANSNKADLDKIGDGILRRYGMNNAIKVFEMFMEMKLF